MTKDQIDEIAIRVAKDRYVAQHSGTGEGINFTNYAEFTHTLLTELAKVQTPVAEVVWYDPALSATTDKAGKIIDASMSFMDTADLGTKLYLHPSPSVPEGYVLVPIEPTVNQIVAGQDSGSIENSKRIVRIYKAMLAAARSE